MGVSKTTGLALAALLLGAAILGGTHAAADEDLKTTLDKLGEQVKEHKSADDITALKADIKSAEDLYAQCEDDKKSRKTLVKLIGDLTRTRKPETDEPVVEAALLALGRIEDPDGAKYVKTYLKQPDAEEVPRHLISAITAAGMIHSDTTVKTLIKLVEKSKVTSVAVGAMNALANFGHNKRTREMILEALVDTVKKDKPGTRPNDRSGTPDPVHTPYSYGGATDRWAALSPVLPGVLNKLTGESFASVEEWAEALDAYKSDLESLFSNKDLTAR